MSQNAENRIIAGSQVEAINGITNQEFFRRFATAGRVVLVGGTALIDRAICRAQRRLDDDNRWSFWSHAFLIEGERVDGHCWVIESDLDFHRKHIRLGVQENRITKFFDEKLYSTVAVLDFKLTPQQVTSVLRAGLDLVADHTRYSLRELVGTLAGLRHTSLREKQNLLAREKSFFCSAFVQHVFSNAGINLTPGLDAKHTTPEDLARSEKPHTTYLLKRAVAESRIKQLREKIRVKKLRT